MNIVCVVALKWPDINWFFLCVFVFVFNLGHIHDPSRWYQRHTGKENPDRPFVGDKGQLDTLVKDARTIKQHHIYFYKVVMKAITSGKHTDVVKLHLSQELG